MNCEYLWVMNLHNGMRPQDIVVLLKLIISPREIMNKDLSVSLKLSSAEITYSLQRSNLAGLVDSSKKVMRKTLLEFIRYGLPHVFPAILGPVTPGIPTAYSAPIMKNYFISSEPLVWPYPRGNERGSSIKPLYPNAVEAALEEEHLYELLALVDVMRLGKVREQELAMKLLNERISK